MVLAPRRWRQVFRQMSRKATGAIKPGTPGRVRYRPLKPIAQGRPECFGVPVVIYSYAFFHCIRGCGCDPRIRPSLRPPIYRGTLLMHHPGDEPRECGVMANVIPGLTR